jgi:hypothetical protein
MKKPLVILGLGLLLWPRLSWAQALQTQPPQGQTRPLASEFAKGVVSPVLSIVYFPVKFAVGTAGAVLGGVSGWATGGNMRAAEGIWRPLTGGSYFVTPQVIDGERPFLPFDGGPYAQPPTRVAPAGPAYMQP